MSIAADFRLINSPAAEEYAACRRSRSMQLRDLLVGSTLSFILEAHSGLSAKIVEEAGFPGIWASGLTISAAFGVRDCNEASWTQVLEVLEFMADAAKIPILLDGDTGYGNFNNARRLVRKLCQRGVAGVCFEDKLFPKSNSLLEAAQPLADIEEFCGKIKAAKDAQPDASFCVIARVEALIAGHGMGEALRRAYAYREAGADAILIHSKQNGPDEIMNFASEWADYAPLVVVPTTYYATPTEVFRRLNIRLVIWANHVLRASINAMRAVCRDIFTQENLLSTEGRIASMQDIFALTDNSELKNAEQRYLVPRVAIVLAAGRRQLLEPLTVDKPKCMLDIRGRPLLEHLVGTLKLAGITQVTIIREYRAEVVRITEVELLDNPDFESTGEIGSLARAAQCLSGPCVVSFGDILFRDFILRRVLETPGDVVVAVDAAWKLRPSRRDRDLVRCSREYTTHYLDDSPVDLVDIGSSEAIAHQTCHGRWIGLMKLSPKGSSLLKELLINWDLAESRSNEIADLLRLMVQRGKPPRVAYITGHWIDVNNLIDLAEARSFS